jgi:1-acyl-sn-glycerol-3-phosphate acyltransferase
MLDLARLDRIRLSARPRFQRAVALTFLAPLYELNRRVKIELVNPERVPDEPVIFAMNHTDRYNYWPFQYAWWRRHDRFTATWVKGKYYEGKAVGAFMEMVNSIPTVSRGYLITKDFMNTLGRRPSEAEYEALRQAVDGAVRGKESVDGGAQIPSAIFERARDMLGRPFDPAKESYPRAIDGLFRAMMRRFVELNEEASALSLDLLIFPQGTRSIRLSRGHGGLSQIAMHLGRTVVPVGCSGTDHIYPGSSPVARKGTAIYRFGEPIRPEDAAAWVPRGTFEPFTLEAEEAHKEAFQRYVDDVMQKIDGLVDPEYRYSADRESEGVEGSRRFV